MLTWERETSRSQLDSTYENSAELVWGEPKLKITTFGRHSINYGAWQWWAHQISKLLQGFTGLSKMHFKPVEVLTMNSPSAGTKAKLEMSMVWEQSCLTHTGPRCGLKYLKVLTRCSAAMKNDLMGKGEKELWGKVGNRSCRVSSVLHWLDSGD